LKNYAYSRTKANLMYYRDASGNEIDVIVEVGNLLHPLEIKKTANPDRRMIRNFAVLDRASLPVGRGGIICMAEEVIPLDANNCVIPCNLI